jgi:DNA-binding beta-propeller fold protein YncE
MIIDTEAKTVATVGSDLSSIVQSLELRGSVFHVIANTGGRVDIHSTETGQRISQVTGLTSPRYSVTLGTGKTYVTNLYKTGFLGGTVSVIDLSLNEVVKVIDVGNNPEGIVAIGGRIFVANHGFGGGTTLSVISTVTDEVVATLDVGCDGPRTLFVDSEVELWVMCTGQTLFDESFNVIGETPGELVVLDGVTGAETTRFPLSSRILTAGPGQDAYYSAAEQELHVVLDQNKVLRVNTGANALVDTFGPFAGDPIGAVAYDANDELLYLGRVPGFATNGTVTVHDRAGVQVDLYSVGVAPSHLEFITEEE